MKTVDFINKRPKKVAAVVEQPVVSIPKLTFPEFTAESAEALYQNLLSEDATAGASCSSSVSVVMTQLGETPANIIKRQKAYTNQMTKGGPVKIKAAK